MKHLFILPATFLLAACAGTEASTAKDGGWTPLPATAWHWIGHKKEDGLPKMWTVDPDGSLHHVAGDGRWTGGDLASDAGDWRNFVFEYEWKIGKAANSGIFYRIKDRPGLPSPSGFECQVLDDDGFQNGKAQPLHRAGALYGILAANDQKTLKPVGEWNTARIVADGDHLEHWLNGKCVLKTDLASAEFKAAFAHSQWKGNLAKGAAPNGTIALQDHGGEVWYRNIRVRKLEK